jgi:hypothetical protein
MGAYSELQRLARGLNRKIFDDGIFNGIEFCISGKIILNQRFAYLIDDRVGVNR